MSRPLDEVYAILDDFEKEPVVFKDIRDQMAANNLNFEQLAPEYWKDVYKFFNARFFN